MAFPADILVFGLGCLGLDWREVRMLSCLFWAAISGAAYAEKAFLNGWLFGSAANGFLNGFGLGARS